MKLSDFHLNGRPLQQQRDASGQIADPVRLIETMISQSRRTGKTTALVDALPEDGICTVILNHRSMYDYLISLIKMRRPNIPIHNLKFIYHRSGTINLAEIRTTQKPIFVDNAVIDIWLLEVIKNINLMEETLTHESK